jgi:hypothetical protein
MSEGRMMPMENSSMPKLRPVIDGSLWEVVEDWQCRLPVSPERHIKISAGFRTDGATIPRWAWSIIGHPMDPIYLRGALVHDALYSSHSLRRITSDRIFRDLILEDGAHRLAAAMMYGAVRALGKAAWEDSNRIATAHMVIVAKSIYTPH